MEYNGAHNDVAMQPPSSIVFGYQPTLNGSLQHDPFMYGASRPGSGFASRAPSPSHDFDAQFESALPAASIFGFLFKDSARDLPGISSILPRLLPVPGFPTDFSQASFGHNNGSTEQPGTYSNYRNDTMSTNNNGSYVTRPSSPVLSFPELEIPEELHDLEDNPHVDRFTEADLSHLQDYTQTQLPSARLINVLIQVYFDRFHNSLPIIHKANYSPGQADHIQTLAIISIGAHYFDKISQHQETLHKDLVILAHRVLKLEQDTFTALQAQFLLGVADLYNVQSQSALEMAEDDRSSLLRRARTKKLFDENYDDSPPDDASTEARWQILRRAEERRRLSWAIWIHDYLFTVFFGVRSLMELNEVKTSLPCPENLWEANTAHEWAEQFAPDRLPLRTRTLWSTGRLEDRGVAECAQYGVFCRTILALVEARRVHDIANAVPLGDPATEGQTQRALRRDAQAVLANARNMSVKALDILEYTLSPTDCASEAEVANALLTIQFARMITAIDLQSVRKYLVGDDRDIRTWAIEMPSHARSASLCAAHIIKLVPDQASPFIGMIAFYATLTLFCFAKFYPANDSLHELQLDAHSCNSPQAQQWISSGSFIPTLKDVGLLDQANVARIVKSWESSVQDSFVWGFENLKLRIDSLSQYI